MRMRLVPLWLLIPLAVVPVCSAQEQAARPFLTARVQSIETLLADSKYLAELVGRKELLEPALRALKIDLM